ncbi:hypothetical protein [Schlesneria sp.]|uniref:hypothetical protein n=1 Tax=Schlesneria sp. TaxID=2762018 RepID=UPI002EF2C191
MSARLFSLLCLAGLIGCSSSGPAGPPLFPVTGNLTVGGKPLADVSVQLVPVDPQPATNNSPGTLTSSGITDASGNFKMTASNGHAGAAKGKYKVVLGYAPKMSQEEQAKAAMRKGPPKVDLPFSKDYVSTRTTPKEVEVTDKTPAIELKL